MYRFINKGIFNLNIFIKTHIKQSKGMKLKIAKVIVIDWVNLHHQIAVTKSIKLFTSFRLILGIGYEALEKDIFHLHPPQINSLSYSTCRKNVFKFILK